MLTSRTTQRILFGGAIVLGAYALRERVAALLARTRSPGPPTDSALVDAISARVLPQVAGEIDVNAEDRVIVLRGELADEDQIVDLEGKIRGVDGVIDVDNRIHLSSMSSR